MHLIILIAAAGIVTGTLLHTDELMLLAALICSGAMLPITTRYLRDREAGKRLAVSALPAVAALLAGLLWGSLWLQAQTVHRLSAAEDGLDVHFDGRITALSEREEGIRLQLEPVGGLLQTPSGTELRRLQVSWRHPPADLRPGMLLRVTVRLRAPHSFGNPLPFDYEAFLLSQGTDATGYIRAGEVLGGASFSLRQRLIHRAVDGLNAAAEPWVAGLVLAEADAFSAAQWQAAQQSGTVHLLVVSGLHTGMVAALGWLLGLALRSLIAAGGQGLRSAIWPPLLCVLLLTGGYVWLAGGGVSLQRAWLMAALLLLISASRWRPGVFLMIGVALLVVLLVNPLIWTRPGFAYSFLAVLALLAGFSGRRSTRTDALWLPQWLVFLVLLPLFVLQGQGGGLSHLLANLLAIPLVTLLLLPLSFLALTGWQWPQQALATVGDWFWQWLDWVNALQLPQVVHLSVPVIVLWYALLILLWVGASRLVTTAVPVLMLLAALKQPAGVVNEVIMADVGQGQALIFARDGHALTYDMGPRYSARFDAGSGIVLPLLMQEGIAQVDALIISHSDTDHAGGLQPFLQLAGLKSVTVDQIFSGQSLADAGVTLCAGQNPDWRVLSESLRWRILTLTAAQRAGVRNSDNNASCVVQVAWGNTRFLLTGDIAQDAEQAYVDAWGNELRSDVLVLAHHGSRSSSSEAFLRAVAPHEVWISAGYHNRFGHPHPQVIERLNVLGLRWLNTATEGALMRRSEQPTQTWRRGWQPAWRA